jgi:hypothetical protein
MSTEEPKPAKFDLYFFPREPSEAGIQGIRDKGKQYEKIYLITEIANKLKESLKSTNLNWQIVVKGYLEANSGALPGGKVGFEATLTLSNQ